MSSFAATSAADFTRLRGASANTYTLSVLPTSADAGWNCALAVALVGVMFEVTVIGKGGGCGIVGLPAPLAVKLPGIVALPTGMANVPEVPLNVPV